MRRTRAAVLVMTTLLATAVHALGLGPIETTSSLNQPFEARVPLVGATPADLDSLAARLADAAQFERAGVGREAVLLGLRFEVVSGAPGAEYVRISSSEPLREPFLNFLVELVWSNGRLVREYTVLLDPPAYAVPPTMPVPAPVPAAAPVSAPVPTASPAPVAPAGVTASVASSGVVDDGASDAHVPDGDGFFAVTPTTTAWGLAMRSRPAPDITVYQMLTALVRANPEAFAHENVHFLRRTARLRLPGEQEARALDPAAAREEFARQTAQRDSLLAPAARSDAPPPAPTTEVARQEAPPTPAATVERAPPANSEPSAEVAPAKPEAAPVAPAEPAAPPAVAAAASEDELFAGMDETAPDALEAALDATAPATDGPRLKLEVPELADTGQVDGGGAGAGSATDALALEQADVVARENEELKAKAKESEEIIALFQQQISDKDKELAALQARVAALEAATRAAAQGTSAANTVPTSPLGLEDMTGPIMGLPALGLLGVLGLLGAWWAYRRRQSGSLLARPAAPAVDDDGVLPWSPPPSSGLSVEEITGSEITRLQTVRMEAPPTEIDPLDEVNVLLAYERFEQAEELVRNAIRTRPDHPAYQLRLLEVFYAANRRRSFEEAARALQATVGSDSPLWQDAVAMWQEMSPQRPLFAPDAASDTGAVDEGIPSTEFVDISAPSPTAAPASGSDPATAVPPALDLDLEATPEPGAPRPVVVDLSTGEGLGTSSRDPHAPVAPAVLDQSMEFDLADTVWPGTSTPVTPAPRPADDYNLEFDIGGLGDTTDLAQALAPEQDPLARSVDLDLSLRDTGGSLRAPAASHLEPASSEDELEFDLALQDTTDLDTVNMREVLKDLEQTVIAPEQVSEESLADITRSMEASIASLDVDAGPDLALEPLDSDEDRDFEFTLDGTTASMLDTLSLDPGALERTASERAPGDVALDLDLDLDDADEPSPLYETDTKLSLAKAYLELGDAEGAREILDEVLQTGNAVQQEEARRLLAPLG